MIRRAFDDEPGLLVVENGLYVVRYVARASVRTVGFAFVGLLAYTLRTTWGWLPPMAATGGTAGSAPASVGAE